MKFKRFIFTLLFFLLCLPTAFGATNFKIKNHKFNVNYNQHGLFITRDDGSYLFHLYGYFESDFMAFQNSKGLLKSGSNIRYATMYLNGTIAKVWQYYLSYDFSSNSLLDANILYYGFPNQYIQVGQFTPNVGFSNWSRHFDINFLEWPLPVFAFSPGYPQGIHYDIHGDKFVGDVSVFSGSDLETYTASNPIGATGHVFFSPIHTNTRALHFGISDWWQRPNNTHTVVFGTMPEATSHNVDMLVTTGNITNVDCYNIISGEAAGVYGPWSLQGEYYYNKVFRKNSLHSLTFSGYYATIGYFLTGESIVYAYPLGAFTSPTKLRHKYGALQLLFRYSTINLNSRNIQGGKEYNATLGLNWFVNNHITFKFNVIRAMAHPASTGQTVNAMIYAARAQIQF